MVPLAFFSSRLNQACHGRPLSPQKMFRIRVFSPPLVLNEPRAVGELMIGDVRRHFALDLRYWHVADYERQWKAGLERLVRGSPSSALMTAYRGADETPHVMWGLWREAGFVYVQPHCVLPAELSDPFDPYEPHVHLGARIPMSEEGLPIAEWRVELEHLVASVLQIRWPPPLGQ